jgi:UDP-N-acetylglucosamine:LPS N-acetylglucosamine transferase
MDANVEDATRFVPSSRVRVLIFSADIGEGHDAPARALRDGILARRPEADVIIADTLAVSGPVIRGAVRQGAEVVLHRLPWLFDLEYRIVARWRPTRAVAGMVLTGLGRRRLLAAVRAARPDVVVCTYPLASHVLGELRRRGLIAAPVVSAVTDLAALRYWAHPGCDLHLTIHPESVDEVLEIAGPRARVVHVRGLSSAAFDQPVDAARARASFGLAGDEPVVAVSGGGWGVGDLQGAIDAALAASPRVRVIALCAHNSGLRRRLEGAFAASDRVRVLGFTDRMGDVLAASDVLVHSTAGLTVLEALVRGARVISYGWGVGHIRANNEAYLRFGLADVVTDGRRLAGAIRAALASPRQPDLAYGQRPSAADLVLALAAAR